MGAVENFQQFLDGHGLVIRICNGAVTICDGNCMECEEEEE